MTTWVALLRGINVGGANKVAMKDLRASVSSLGYADVVTYIQSGNVVFDTGDDATESAVNEAIRSLLVETHGLEVPVVVRTATEFEGAADRHPDADGGIDPKLLHVAFLDRTPAAAAVADLDPQEWDPDRWSLVGRELYLTYPDGSARSKMTIDRFERPWGVTATARNLNSVRKIVELARSR